MDEGARRESDDPKRRHTLARVAGFAYLVTIISGMFAEAFVRGTLRVPGDAASTAANLLAAQPLYQLAILADLVMLASYIVVTALLYRVFKPSGPSLSLTAACFSLIGIALLAANTGLLAGPSVLLGNSDYLLTFNAEQREALVYAILSVHGRIYNYSGLFFGFYCIVIGLLAMRSGELPRWVGSLMMLAGVTFVLDVTLELALPWAARQVPEIVMLISLLGEGALALWLAIFGLSRRARKIDEFRDDRGVA